MNEMKLTEQSDWYRPSGNPDPRLQKIFIVQDIHTHSSMRRKIAYLYSKSFLVKLEDFVDELVDISEDRFSQIAIEGRKIDL